MRKIEYTDLTVSDIVSAIDQVFPDQKISDVVIARAISNRQNEEINWFEELEKLLHTSGYEVRLGDVLATEACKHITIGDFCAACFVQKAIYVKHQILSIYSSGPIDGDIMASYYCPARDCDMEYAISLETHFTKEQARLICEYIERGCLAA